MLSMHNDLLLLKNAHQYLTHQNVWYLTCSVKHNIGLFIKGETSFIEIKAEQNRSTLNLRKRKRKTLTMLKRVPSDQKPRVVLCTRYGCTQIISI